MTMVALSADAWPARPLVQHILQGPTLWGESDTHKEAVMGFLIRWGVLVGVITVLGLALTSRQFAAADDVVTARGEGAVVFEALANDKAGFMSAVRRLTITEPPRYGTVDVAKDGTFTYQPTELVTIDSFTYEAETTSGGTGSARVIIERQPGKGVSVTAPVDLTGGGTWWWWVVIAGAGALTVVSLSHRLRSRSLHRQLS